MTQRHRLPVDDEVVEQVVLVTVFGSFPGQDVNPTEDIADALAGEDHVVSHVLDVSFDRAVAQVDELVRMVAPAAVVAFGVAGSADRVRLEEVARNHGGARAIDVDGDLGPDGAIDDGPPLVPTRLPLADIAAALEGAGLPYEPSADAGDYVCNRLFRHLVTSPDLAGRPVGFVHVPDPARHHAVLSAEEVVLAGRVVVDTVAAHVLRA